MQIIFVLSGQYDIKHLSHQELMDFLLENVQFHGVDISFQFFILFNLSGYFYLL